MPEEPKKTVLEEKEPTPVLKKPEPRVVPKKPEPPPVQGTSQYQYNHKNVSICFRNVSEHFLFSLCPVA